MATTDELRQRIAALRADVSKHICDAIPQDIRDEIRAAKRDLAVKLTESDEARIVDEKAERMRLVKEQMERRRAFGRDFADRPLTMRYIVAVESKGAISESVQMQVYNICLQREHALEAAKIATENTGFAAYIFEAASKHYGDEELPIA